MSGTLIVSRGPLFKKYGHILIDAQRQELTDRILKLRETPTPPARPVESVIYAKDNDVAVTPYGGIVSIMGVPTVRYISHEVAAYFGTTVDVLKSSSRNKEVATRRQIGIWLSYRLTTKSTIEVGKLWGGRDHSTVIHACSKITEILNAGRYSRTSMDVERLLQTVGGEIALEGRYWGA